VKKKISHRRFISRLRRMTGVGFMPALAVLFSIAAALPAPAQTFSVLYAFHGGTDGASPVGALVRDAAGDLFGATANGGKQLCSPSYGVGCGTIFKVDAAGVETILHSFGGKADGFDPLSGVFGSGASTLYGSAALGGDVMGCNSPIGCGLIFRLDTRTLGFSVLHTFTGLPDGFSPGGLSNDAAGNIYGVTEEGGAFAATCGAGCGTVFKLDPNRVETVLYKFTGGADGSFPSPRGDRLVQDSAGNLYGTTDGGGQNPCLGGTGCGVEFKVQPNGVETVLHTFTGGADGAGPSGLIPSPSGALYGTTASGGDPGLGTVFKVDVNGNFRVLYNFTGGADGRGPLVGLVRDSAGNLYGVNPGSSSSRGVVFKLDPTGVLSVLYNFTGGADGGGPDGPLLLDAAGNLYGVTAGGGDLTCNPPSGCGVVFKIAP